MERLIAYLLQMVLVSGMLTTWYCLVLRNRRLHDYNRFYLLATLVLSLLLPLIPLGWTPFARLKRPVLGGTVERVENISRSANNGIPWLTIGLVIAGLVSFALLVLTVLRIKQVLRLKRQQPSRSMGTYDLIETRDPRAPFSFLKILFWPEGEDPAQPENQKILSHELAHIHGKHSWDSLFTQGLSCLFWLNPFFWIIRRELIVVHEFIADAATGMEGNAEGFALMLLHSVNEGRFLTPAQGFFQSPIKRRLMMIDNNKPLRFHRVRKTLALLIVFAAIAVISCSKGQPTAALDALDQKKIALDKKEHQLFLKLKNNKLLQLKKFKATASDSIFNGVEIKQKIDILLRKAEESN